VACVRGISLNTELPQLALLSPRRSEQQLLINALLVIWCEICLPIYTLPYRNPTRIIPNPPIHQLNPSIRPATLGPEP